MKNRTALIAALSGIACAFLIWCYMNSLAQEVEADRAKALEQYGGEQTEILIATRDIYPGETLDASNTRTQVWIASMLPEGALQNIDGFKSTPVSSAIFSGEVITEKRFSSIASHIDVPEGKVALSIPVEEVQAVGGAIEVGSLVDIYATGTTTTSLGNNIPILALSCGSNESGNAKVTWVTVALDPARVQEYVTASEQMELYLALPAQKTSLTKNGSSGTTEQQTTTTTGD